MRRKAASGSLFPQKKPAAQPLADRIRPASLEEVVGQEHLLGPGKLLCPEVWVLLETDPAAARRAAREALSRYLQLENYVNSWRREGFGDDDLAGGGSQRFLDAMVAWGDEGAIRVRVQQHWDAGADHVCIQPISPQGSPPGSRQIVDDRILELLAPARRS